MTDAVLTIAPPRRFDPRAFARAHAALLALTGVLVVIATVTALQSDVFLTVNNLRNILLQVSVLAIVAAATTLLMVSGGIDLSVGYLMSVVAVVIATLGESGVPLLAALAIGIALGATIGATNGVLAAWSPAHPFIVTLGVAIVLQGVAIQITGGAPVSGLDDRLLDVATARVLGVPVPVLIAGGVLLGVSWLLRRTVFGRRLYAIGGSEPAAYLAGVPVRRTKIIAYLISGVLCAVAGIVLMSRIASAQPLMGAGYEFEAIAAVAVGGTPLAGGRGGILGTAIGVLLLGVISNSLNLLGVAGAFQYVLQGTVIVIAVMSQRGGR